MELQRSGFSDEEIQAHENALRQNSTVSTARALKEHFILERIAEEEEIDAGQAGLRRGNPPDRRPEQRVAAAGPGAAGEIRLDGRAPQPDHRAQGDRPDPRSTPPSAKRLTSCTAPTKRPWTTPPAAASTPTSPRPSTTRARKCPKRRKRDGGERGEETDTVGVNCKLEIADFKLAICNLQLAI